MICICNHLESSHRNYTSGMYPIPLPGLYTICRECEYNKNSSLHEFRGDNLKYLEMKSMGEI